MLNVGAAQMTNIGGLYSINVGASMTETIGKKLTIDAGDEILIKTGSSSILMKKDGTITIEGKVVTINGSDKVKVSAKSELEMDGGKFELKAGTGQGSVTASTILEIKGATVKINC